MMDVSSGSGGKDHHIAASTANEAALTKMALVENNTAYHEFVDPISGYVRFFVARKDDSEIADTITIIKIKIDFLPKYADQYKYEIEKYEKYFSKLKSDS